MLPALAHTAAPETGLFPRKIRHSAELNEELFLARASTAKIRLTELTQTPLRTLFYLAILLHFSKAKMFNKPLPTISPFSLLSHGVNTYVPPKKPIVRRRIEYLHHSRTRKAI